MGPTNVNAIAIFINRVPSSYTPESRTPVLRPLRDVRGAISLVRRDPLFLAPTPHGQSACLWQLRLTLNDVWGSGISPYVFNPTRPPIAVELIPRPPLPPSK